MADESEFNNELEEKSRSEKRIKDLSEKVKLTAQERDELAKEKETFVQEKTQLAKENEFYKNFNTLASRYQGSVDFQDKIKEKFMAGYDIEDATVAVLNKEGKFTPDVRPIVKENPAGGSASTQLRTEDKSVGELTRDEKRAKLIENEAELIDILSPKFR